MAKVSSHGGEKEPLPLMGTEDLMWDNSFLPFVPVENVPEGARELWAADGDWEPMQGIGAIAAGMRSAEPSREDDEMEEYLMSPPERETDGAEPDELEEMPEYDYQQAFVTGISPAKQRRADYLQRYMETRLDGLSDRNVLEMLLHFSIPLRNTSLLADSLLEQFGSLPGVLGAGLKRTLQVPGMNREAAVQLDMLMRVAQRAIERQNEATDLLDTDEKVGNYLTRKFYGMTEETVILLCMDNSCRLISCTKLSSGLTNRAGVDLRAICETAFRCNAPIVILAHNHPGGKAYPSDEDIRATTRIQQMLRLVDVNLVDHFVIAGNQWKSMAKMGELSVVRVTDIIRGV